MSANLRASELADTMQNVQVVFLEASWNGSSWSMTNSPLNPAGVTIRTDNTGPANPWFDGLPRGMFYFVTDLTVIISSAAQACHTAIITSSPSAAPDAALNFGDGRLRINTRSDSGNVNLSSAATLRVCLEVDRGRS